ncbi:MULTISPECIES: diiron oxygenase [Burkholderia]|uniref:Diiron oxygenase n=1 Tax=Burkholderia sola TaxID=2843302 RepID=A0ABV2C922_9BURK|nr:MULTISPECIES: diiron oxygenase [unclassified Burkholderia]MBP0607668.1 diiron oxygenase [Burkholderia sp. CpTa8-5]MBP0717639.1 diiron oxygenase [Burkholderia sp. AcTa6-5]
MHTVLDRGTDSSVLGLMRKISSHWSARAQTRKCDLPDDFSFLPERDDFVPNLVPFWTHPALQPLVENAATRSRLLSIGWLVYNLKTVTIESRIVTPVCVELLDNGVSDFANDMKRIVAETLTDESFHTLLAIHTCQIACRERNLRIGYTAYTLVDQLDRYLATLDDENDRFLARLATCTVSELFIGGYLACINDASRMQPLFVDAVNAHRMDELMHGSIFGLVVDYVHDRMSAADRRLFAEVCALAIRWFEDDERECWGTLASLNGVHIPRAVLDAPPDSTVRPSRSNYTNLLKLLNRLEMGDAFQESLNHHGIVLS